jgi:glycosyl transferase family 87
MPIRDFFLYKIISNRKLSLIFWFVLCLLGVWQGFRENGLNNYFIYKNVFFHTLHHQNLYVAYPSEYNDINLYGPFFSIVMAPFAWLPDKIGIIAWAFANAAFLLFAISKLPLSNKWQAVLLFLCCHELMICSESVQINPLICGCILLGFAYTEKQKEQYALLFIMAAGFIKIYGFVGLVFLVFSKRQFQFLIWAVIWGVVFFFSPMIIGSFSFLLSSYEGWFETLRIKNAKNILLDGTAIYQNVSVPGMIRRIFYLPQLNDLYILVPAVILFFSQLIYHKKYRDPGFRLYILCSVLIATVIFSSGAESSTYIIAIPGMCIWYFLQPKTKFVRLFFAVAFLLTSFAYSDLFTPWSRNHLFRPYSLKALMPFVTWLLILFQIHSQQFKNAVITKTAKLKVLQYYE